mmetsp:Transcript_9310/g.22708  ORF Transcript_9310/g.22708 Transcript_9310/m.22708 type:complete len:231 (-) Transcript_9310:420-1112(-)
MLLTCWWLLDCRMLLIPLSVLLGARGISGEMSSCSICGGSSVVAASSMDIMDDVTTVASDVVAPVLDVLFHEASSFKDDIAPIPLSKEDGVVSFTGCGCSLVVVDSFVGVTDDVNIRASGAIASVLPVSLHVTALCKALISPSKVEDIVVSSIVCGGSSSVDVVDDVIIGASGLSTPMLAASLLYSSASAVASSLSIPSTEAAPLISRCLRSFLRTFLFSPLLPWDASSS